MKFDFKYLLLALLTISPSFICGKNHDYVVVSKKEVVALLNQKLIKRTELLLQINSKEGEKAAEFVLGYSPLDKLVKLAAWIQDTTGKVIRKLEKKQINDRSAFSYGTFYSDYRERSFELKHNHFPYQIHVEYSYETYDFLHIVDWSPIYGTKVPTYSAILIVEIPINCPIKILQQKIASPTIDTTDGTLRYTWTGEYLHLIKEEACQPPAKDLRPYVSVVPRDFKYGIKGSFASWETYGDYIDGLMQDLGSLPPSEISRIKSITSGVTDTLELIKKLFHYLQDNTRYINISIDIGGMKPYPASYVAQNKFGDCKALSLYMKSLLEVVGISSFFTLVYGGKMPNPIETDFPAQRFNHAIICLPYRSDTLWLDCTSKDFPVGYTSAFIQGRPALVVSRGKSRLVNIPFLKSDEVVSMRTYHFSAIDNETMEVAVHSIYKGSKFETINFYSTFADKEEQREMARDLLPFINYDLLNYTFTKNSPDDISITFNAHVKVKDVVINLDDKIVFTPPTMDIPSFEKTHIRQYPVFFPYPIWSIDKITIAVPAGMAVKSLPATELTCENGSYKVTSSLDGQNLIYMRDVLFRRGTIGLGQYPVFYNWVGSIRAFERQNKIIFSPIHE